MASTAGSDVGQLVSMTAERCQCGCRSVEGVWWHVRLLYVLICILTVVYSCSVTWILITTRLPPSQDRGEIQVGSSDGPSTDVVDPVSGGIGHRVRRNAGRQTTSHQRRRSSAPAFYRDSSAAGNGKTVDSDEWVWMSTYSKIPVRVC